MTSSDDPNQARSIERLVNETTKEKNLKIDSITTYKIYAQATFPDPKEHDAYILSGGKLGVYEKEKYSHIVPSMKFVRALAKEGVPTLGICYGHQLIAEALGCKVLKTKAPEIGWKRIILNEDGKNHPLFENISAEFDCYEYHQDQVVALPPNSKRLASSQYCINEAYETQDTKFIGIQFHPEVKPSRAEEVFMANSKKLSRLGLNPKILIAEGYIKYDDSISITLMYNFLTMVKEWLNTKPAI